MQSEYRRTQVISYVLESVSIFILMIVTAAIGILHFTCPPTQYSVQDPAMENTVQARVLSVQTPQMHQDNTGFNQVQQVLELEILTAGPYEGQVVTVEYNGMGSTLEDVAFKQGERALVMVNHPPNGEAVFIVTDHVRLGPLIMLAATLALVALVIGKWQGFRALVGLSLSVIVLGSFIIPQILADRDPVLVTLVGIGAVLAVTTFLIQGWNPPAHVALLSIMASLLTTAILAMLWTRLVHLSGFGSEETLYLHAMGVRLNMRGLLLAGIIIGAGGVLDDVVLAQSVSAFELAAAAPELSFHDLYHRTMKVGNAHLLTMINTLVLAYASAALPLMILFVLYPEPGSMTLNRELIAQEVVHTLVGSLGVMLAVPLTTGIATWVAHRLPTPPAS